MSNWDSIANIADGVKSGVVSAESNVRKALNKLKETEEYQHSISLIEERAIERAKG